MPAGSATGSRTPPSSPSRVTRLATVAGGLLAAAGALASLAVFVFPTADGRHENRPPSGSATATAPAQGAPARGTATGTAPSDGTAPPHSTAPPDSTAPPGGTAPPADDVRTLAGIAPAAGAGLVSVRGQDLLVACPSNQSDDREREITYRLTRSFDRLEGTVSLVEPHRGQAGPDDRVGVRAFIEYRQERSDRRDQTGTAAAGRGRPGTLSASLRDATRVSLVVTCTNADTALLLHSPRLVPAG